MNNREFIETTISEIATIIHKDNGRGIKFKIIRPSGFFAYLSSFFTKIITLELYTVREEICPGVSDKFLLTSVKDKYHIALFKILRFVKNKPVGYQTYTVEWKARYGLTFDEIDNRASFTSYFYATNMKDVLEKFYADKPDIYNYTIFSITLNPLS